MRNFKFIYTNNHTKRILFNNQKTPIVNIISLLSKLLSKIFLLSKTFNKFWVKIIIFLIIFLIEVELIRRLTLDFQD